MPTVRSPTATFVLSLAAALAVTACGGDDDDTAARSAATATSAALATTATTTAIESTESTATEITEAPETTEAVETTAVAPTTVAAGDYVFTSAEGDYTVTFPGEPTMRTVPQALPDGSTIDLIFAGYGVGSTYVTTARGKYPDGTVLDPPVALQGIQDRAIAGAQGTLIASRDIALQGRPGREFSASITSSGQPAAVLTRAYLDGLVVYQQICVCPSDASFTDPELAAFFDSFAFTAG